MKIKAAVLSVFGLVACIASTALSQTGQDGAPPAPVETMATEAEAPPTETPQPPPPTNAPAPVAAEPPEATDGVSAEDLQEFEEFKRWREMRKAQQNAPVVPAEPAATPSPSPSTFSDTAPARRWRLALGFGAMASSQPLKFEESTFSDSTGSISGEAEFTLKKANSVFVELRDIRNREWGFIGGVKVEGEREIEKIRLSSGNSSATVVSAGSAAKFQFTTYYANAVYAWDQIYLPFGLNYSVVDLKDLNKSVNIESETRSAFGSQLGLGFQATPHLAFELSIWSLGVEQYLKVNDVILDFGDGTLTSTLLTLKLMY